MRLATMLSPYLFISLRWKRGGRGAGVASGLGAVLCSGTSARSQLEPSSQKAGRFAGGWEHKRGQKVMSMGSMGLGRANTLVSFSIPFGGGPGGGAVLLFQAVVFPLFITQLP